MGFGGILYYNYNKEPPNPILIVKDGPPKVALRRKREKWMVSREMLLPISPATIRGFLLHQTMQECCRTVTTMVTRKAVLDTTDDNQGCPPKTRNLNP